MLKDDVKCPYCEKWQAICHDDGCGYEEDVIYEQTCDDCEMVFAYTASISYCYEARKAPCMNGGEHNWKNGTKECLDCGLSESGEAK